MSSSLLISERATCQERTTRMKLILPILVIALVAAGITSGLKCGTHEHDCFLKRGGTLHYAYACNDCDDNGGCGGQLKVFDLRAKGLPSGLLGITDGYVKVFRGAAFLGKTSVRNNQANPWWSEEFSHFSGTSKDLLKLEVWDSDFIFDDLLGTCIR